MGAVVAIAPSVARVAGPPASTAVVTAAASATAQMLAAQTAQNPPSGFCEASDSEAARARRHALLE